MYPTFPEVMIVCCAAGSLLLYITKKVSVLWLYIVILVAMIEVGIYAFQYTNLRPLLGAVPIFVWIDGYYVKRMENSKTPEEMERLTKRRLRFSGIIMCLMVAAILMDTDVAKLAILLVPVMLFEIYRFCRDGKVEKK